MWLTFRSGNERGRTVFVDADTVIGRDDACDVVVDDPNVSRRHVSLEPLEDGRVTLRDLGSSNGTFLNGHRIQSAVLEGNEQIQIGGAVLVSSRDDPAAGRANATHVGSLAGALQTPSAVHRLVVQRSLRRVTLIATAAVATAAGAALLFATGVLPVGDDAAGAVQRVVERVSPSTVFVEARRDGRRVGGGSGWVLDGPNGLIVTNAHVLNGGTSVLVGAGREAAEAAVVGVAPCEDLAVLRVRRTNGLRTLPLGSQSSLEQGETVVAVGYPANASAEVSLSSTTGVVSVVKTAYREPAVDVPRYSNVVQTDAAINPGSSGGPLVDLEGRLVGVSAAGRTLSADGRVIQGQSYAIGVDRVKEVVAVLRTGRSIGWTGVGFGYRNERVGGQARAGLVARGAVSGTSAQRAGLGADADVITAVNGLPLDNSLASYCDAVAGLRSGERVTFSVVRAGSSRPREVALTLE